MRLCAIAVPAGFTSTGLPFGVTLLAQEGADVALLQLAADWQALFNLPLGNSKYHATDSELIVKSTATPSIQLAVVGAHLQGLPLHYQLVDRHAHLVKACNTAKSYRLYALPNTKPPKPGLVKDPVNGAKIALEVYEMPITEVGSFLELIPTPLGLGSVELDDGTWVKGFICEPYAINGAKDISHLGGWKAYIHQLGAQQ